MMPNKVTDARYSFSLSIQYFSTDPDLGIEANMDVNDPAGSSHRVAGRPTVMSRPERLGARSA